VKRAVRHIDGREFAIKCIKKSRLTREELYIIDSEVVVMRTLRHKHIVRLFEIFETKKRIYIVMELLSGGELFDRIVQKGSFSEREAAEVMRDLSNAISYLHSIGVVHRDLKPENILYSSPRPDAALKITDFGLAKRSERDKGYMTTACGTPGYVAPEVLKGDQYDQAVDMWSLGVILYILLCGFPPFYSDNTAELYAKIKAGDFAFPSPYWDEISPAAMELVRGLLTVDPTQRLTAAQVLEHPWVSGGLARGSAFSQQHTNRIRLLQAKRKLRRNVQIIIACNRFTSILRAASELDPSHSASSASAHLAGDVTAHLPEDLTLMAYRRHNLISDGQDISGISAEDALKHPIAHIQESARRSASPMTSPITSPMAVGMGGHTPMSAAAVAGQRRQFHFDQHLSVASAEAESKQVQAPGDGEAQVYTTGVSAGTGAGAGAGADQSPSGGSGYSVALQDRYFNQSNVDVIKQNAQAQAQRHAPARDGPVFSSAGALPVDAGVSAAAGAGAGSLSEEEELQVRVTGAEAVRVQAQ
jgi:calcium/calmodulin-dependent protein kinase I